MGGRFPILRRLAITGLVVAVALIAARSAIVFAAKPPVERRAVSLRAIRDAADRLRPMYDKKQPGDWMRAHPEEKGQTFDQYRARQPAKLTGALSTLYVQPLGELSPTHGEMVELTRDFLGRFYGVPVRQLDPVSIDDFPADARRIHPDWGDDQLLSTYVLNDVLRPNRPDDALAVLGLTAIDLWPGAGWNFVFGQASLSERVGVWSLYRYGDPTAGDAQRLLCLRRTLKVATHETGHMLGITHCTAYACGMNGSNSLPETDAGPLAFCPHCAAKVWWATDRDPAAWHESLIEFADRQGLTEEAEAWREALDRVRRRPK
jgi:archaemetzincin